VVTKNHLALLPGGLGTPGLINPIYRANCLRHYVALFRFDCLWAGAMTLFEVAYFIPVLMYEQGLILRPTLQPAKDVGVGPAVK